eukprot:SAG31_NODE_4106_length_3577_cov_3.156699_3_plen_88_part_00
MPSDTAHLLLLFFLKKRRKKKRKKLPSLSSLKMVTCANTDRSQNPSHDACGSHTPAVVFAFKLMRRGRVFVAIFWVEFVRLTAVLWS